MTLFLDDELAAATGGIVDLFAGPGGWSEGLRMLGEHDVGVELDRWACATRRAAGHATVEADVAALDPHDFTGTTGLIASPPCQAFSTAGRKHGRTMLDKLLDAVDRGHWHARPHHDPNVWLALEVGRWFEALWPEWVALEQVPSALPIWEHYAERLHGAGWSTWTGVVNAADYGVPQTRRRAVLLASAVVEVGPPPPTHAERPSAGLLPWRTMLEALDGDPALSWKVSTGRDWNADTGTSQVVDGATSPAPTLTGKAPSQWLIGTDRRPVRDAAVAELGGLFAETTSTRPETSQHSVMNTARRLTVAEALVLQSFPSSYPVQGTPTSAFEQIGNAVPPLLARHLLAQVITTKGQP